MMTRIRSALMLCLFAAFLLSAAFPVQATYFSVGCTNGVGDVAGLQSMVTEANTNDQADTITLTAGCTYTLTTSLEVRSDGGQPLVIDGQGATISGNDEFQLIIAFSGSQITLNNVTLTDGFWYNGGGAIDIFEGQLTVQDSTLRSHSSTASYYGGSAIRAHDSDVTIIGSLFTENTLFSTGGRGSAVYAKESTLVITDSVFTHNPSPTPTIMLDGGLLTMTGSTVSHNGGTGITLASGYHGASAEIRDSYILMNADIGIHIGHTPLLLIDSVVAGNSTTSDGGGMAVYAAGAGSMNVINTEFTANTTTGWGGGIYLNSGGVVVENSRFFANSALSGGAINDSSDLIVMNSLFAGNRAVSSGAISSSSYRGLEVTGSYFYRNIASQYGGIATAPYSGQPSHIHQNCFVGNSAYAVYNNYNAYVTSDAANNWWGHISGPGGAGGGLGDSISTHLLYLPFLTSAPANCVLPAPQVSLFASAVTVQEGQTAPITLVRRIPADLPLTVPFTRSGNASAEDYQLSIDSTPLTGNDAIIPAESAGITITAAMVRDYRDEPQDETLTLTLVDNPAYAVTDYARTIAIEIIDMDVSQVLLWGAPPTLIEGESYTYSAALTTIPYADVTVTAHFDPAEVMINGETDGSAELVFNEANWSISQPFTVTAVDDAVPENEQVYQFLGATTITHTVTSADALYDGYPVPDFPLIIRDNDVDICAVQDQIPVSECLALIDFYESTNGDQWTDRKGWLDSATICGMWDGVVCEYLPPAGGDPLVTPEPNEWAVVVSLILSQNNLTGTLPDSFINLPHLRYVAMHSNAITGNLPDLESLSELEALNLSGNHLNGEIPPLPPEIVALSLVHNYLTGSIPEMASLSELTQVELFDNQLSGEIPSLPPALHTLALDDNLLTGSIPPLPAALNYFSASGNHLTGSIPALPPTLEYLYLNDNALSGEIPPLPSNLQALYLHGNQLTGSIPLLPSSLWTLRLEDNRLSGVVPPSIAETIMSPYSYLLTLCGGANDLASDDPAVNTFIEARAPGWATYNGCLPRLSVIDVVDIVPDPPLAPVGTIDVVLSELADLSTFTVEDLLLMRYATIITLDSSVTVALQDAATVTYRISGLAPFTTPYGGYMFAVRAAGLRDQYGLLPDSISANSVLWTWGNPGSLTVEVDLQGRPAAPHASYAIPVDVTLETAGGVTALHETITLDTYGMFTLANLIPGDYTLRVKPVTGLALSQAITVTSSPNSVYMGVFPTGDANGDNRVSLLDFSLLAGAFGTSQGAPGYNPAVDFNGNTVIDLLDFSALASNYGTAGAD